MIPSAQDAFTNKAANVLLLPDQHTMELTIGLLAFTNIAVAMQVNFFYSEVVDRCKFKGQSITANDNSQHGGVCAFAPVTERVYACPAPDPACWTWYEDVSHEFKANFTRAQTCNANGIGQTVCNRGDTQFCCNSVAGETCTTTEGQINVCISNFTSPNNGISPSAANSVYLQALGLNSVTATSQTADPSAFSTLSPSRLPTTTSSVATSSSSISNASPTVPSTSSLASLATASNAAVNTGSPNHLATQSGLSVGAIAGIVLGALIGLAVIGTAAFFIVRQRKRSRHQKHTISEHHAVTPLAYTENNEKARFGNHYGGETPSEIDSERSRVEMSAHSQATRRYEMP